jgi:hypothetical protein
VKIRSRLIGAAAAAGMAATAFTTIGGAGVAHAAPSTLTLLSCSDVHFVAKFTPPISNTPPAETATGYPGVVAIAKDTYPITTTHCTSPDFTQGAGMIPSFGDYSLISGKLTGGAQACSQDNTGQWPMSGLVTVKYTGVNAATTLQYSSSAFIRTANGDPTFIDMTHISGLVTKGVGLGGDVSGAFIQMPIQPKPLNPPVTKPPTAKHVYTPPTPAGPTYESAAYAIDCSANFHGFSASFGLPDYDPFNSSPAYTPATSAEFSNDADSIVNILQGYAPGTVHANVPLTVTMPWDSTLTPPA